MDSLFPEATKSGAKERDDGTCRLGGEKQDQDRVSATVGGLKYKMGVSLGSRDIKEHLCDSAPRMH